MFLLFKYNQDKAIKALLILLTVSSLGFAAEIQELYKKPLQHLSVAPAIFIGNNPSFKWLGANQRVARADNCTFLDYSISEATVYFSRHGKLSGLDAFIYINKEEVDSYDGPSSMLRYTHFKESYLDVVKDLNEYFHVKGKLAKKRGLAGDLIYVFPVSPKWVVYVEIGYEKRPFEGRYINLSIRSKKKTEKVDSRRALSFINNNDNGDVIIEGIPMLDQQTKDYSEVTTLSRVALHYDIDLNKYKTAKLLQFSLPSERIELSLKYGSSKSIVNAQFLGA